MAEPRSHASSYGTYVAVWAALLVLTALLVVSGRSFHEALAVPALLVITPMKASLVFYFFMHVRDEKPYIVGMILVALVTLMVFIGLTFVDLSYR